VARQLRNGTFEKTTCPFDQADGRSDNMTSHTEKPSLAPLIHHPSDALDCFCRYDASSRAWSQFDIVISVQIADFEDSHPQYRRLELALHRRSERSKKPR
jgi:hypothetical protein